jgi:dynein heavy chain 1
MNIFRTWDDPIKEFTDVTREVTRKRSEKFIPIKVQPGHAKLQERTRYIRDWRKQHEQLTMMTGPTKGLGAWGWKWGDCIWNRRLKRRMRS